MVDNFLANNEVTPKVTRTNVRAHNGVLFYFIKY